MSILNHYIEWRVLFTSEFEIFKFRHREVTED